MTTNRILSLLTAGSAFYLLIAGAQVNAYQAALSVPDWPLSYGHVLAPDWPGNVFYEQHHRATAATTLLLFVALAVALGRSARGALGAPGGALAAAKRMATWAGGALATQIILGGLIVLRLNPPWLGAVHVVVAVATVVLIAATALLVWNVGATASASPAIDRILRRSRIAFALVALQLVFGAVSRHPPIGELTFVTTLMAHLLNGVIATMFIVLLAASMIRTPKADRLRPWGWLLLTTVVAQVIVGGWVFVIAPEPFDQPFPPPAGFPAAHAAHLVLAAAIATCLTAPLLRKTRIPAGTQPVQK